MFKSISNKKVLSSLVLGAALFAGGLNAKAVNCDSKTFNIKVKDSITKLEVLNQLSDICNFTVITKDELAVKKLNEQQQGINIKNLSLDDIFALLLGENGLEYVFDNDILKINGYTVKTFKLDYINSIREASALLQASVENAGSDSSSGSSGDSGAGINSVKSQEKFDFWKDIGTEIKNILLSIDQSAATIDPIINQNTGMVTVRGTREQIDSVTEYIETMKERLKKQVIIDVSIIEVSYSDEHKRGIDWDKFNLTFDTKLATGGAADAPATGGAAENNENIVDNFSKIFVGHDGSKGTSGKEIQANLGINIEGVLGFLEGYGKTRVVSNPKIIAMNNQPAIISVGKTVNYILRDKTNNDSGSTEGSENKNIFIGILLNILPEISDDNKVMLRINPALSDFLYDVDNNPQAKAREVAPDTQQKKLSTVVRVNDGQTIILGGLIDNTIQKIKKEVPLISKIPLLGYLFKYENSKDVNREIVFVITPRVVELGSYEHKKSLTDLGYSDDMINPKDSKDAIYNFVTIKGLKELKSKENTLDDMGYEE